MEKDVKKNFSDLIEPTIKRGDFLALERTDKVHGGEIYHITMQNGVDAVCRVYPNGDTITMKYDADPDATQTIPKEFVTGVWRVIALCRYF